MSEADKLKAKHNKDHLRSFFRFVTVTREDSLQAKSNSAIAANSFHPYQFINF